MKKRYIVLISLLSLFFSIKVNAEVISLTDCLYTDEYIKYLGLSDEEKQKTIEPIKCQEELLNSSYTSTSSDANLTKYDLRQRNEISKKIVDQGDLGICWAISTEESIQSNLLKNNKGSYDFSEAHLDLATQNTYDFKRTTFTRKQGTGASYLVAGPYLFNHWGPVGENVFTLDNDKLVQKGSLVPNASQIVNQNHEVEVNEITRIGQEVGACSEDSKKAIKNYLVQNGALTTGIYLDVTGSSYSTVNNEIKSTFTNGAYYYYDGSSYMKNGRQIEANKEFDHSVTIVGFDDTISKNSFASEHLPKEDGAWIIKNSWGTVLDNGAKAGDDGYYYVSYEDVNICRQVYGYYDVDTKLTAHTYNTNNLGYNKTLTLNDKNHDIYQGAVFNTNNDEELLEKISFNAIQTGQTYTVYYANNKSMTNLQKIASGVVDHTGYITVKLTNPIKITTNNFAIVVQISNEKQIILPVLAKGDSFFTNVKIEPNKTYLSLDKTNWVDTTNYESETFQIPIYAYTNDVLKIEPCTTVDGKYYDKDGKSVSIDEYNESCKLIKCTYKNEKYYDSLGNVTTKEEYKNECKKDNLICAYDNFLYYDKLGNVVEKSEYDKSCNDKPSNDNNSTIVVIPNNNNNNKNDLTSTDIIIPSSSNEIENPQTGAFLPIILLPLLLIGLYLLKKSFKKKFIKL